MKDLTVRVAREDEFEQLIEWALKNPHSAFDLETLGYPLTRIYVAENGSPVSYLPVQTAYFLESLAPDPSASRLVRAKALKELVMRVIYETYSNGGRELYFVSSDPDIDQIAEDHGFEVMESKILRLRLKSDGSIRTD